MGIEQQSKRVTVLPMKEKKYLWGIILAGGDGNRLQNYVERLYGYNRPKQYCTIVGTRSLIKHTLDRAKMLIPSERLMTVVNSSHEEYVSEEIGYQLPETIIEQPCNRDTGAGILLPMLKINHLDSEAIVTIFPSDHFIKEEDRFMENVWEANVFVHNHPDAIVMLGTKPVCIETGYGWIETGYRVKNNSDKVFRRVNNFWEKPEIEQLERLLMNGCLINTFVLVGRCESFIKYIKECVPDLFEAFKPIRINIGTYREKVMIKRMYHEMPAKSFSKFVLSRIPEHIYALEVTGVYWSDWGEEHRIRKDINRHNLNKKAPLLAVSSFCK
ncbi:MAG: sugar phosphate nucleotidyltransferase [Bacteroidetes bacterium]|nr:sugar phosphate nucleotidyltransferase [Bacteroidota bacterium]